MTRDEIERGRYLGDGVYVKFDGYHIVLWVQEIGIRVDGCPAIALEPEVMQNLLRYIQELEEYARGSGS